MRILWIWVAHVEFLFGLRSHENNSETRLNGYRKLDIFPV